MKIEDLLRKMPEESFSDLLVFTGKKPCYRKNNAIIKTSLPPVEEEEINAFMKSVLRPEASRRLQELGACDAGISLSPAMRYRINFFIRQGRAALVARFVPSGGLSFAELNLPDVIRKLAEKPRGLILVAGPAGSGKSTTVAAIVNHINANFAKHIVTIEDPVEFLHSDKMSVVTQRELDSDTSTFAEALKNVVRESPDVIVIGEMRDIETMRAAINAALTGHLVISTLHTSNVLQSIERIINHFPDYLRAQVAADLALALEGITAQRLIPSSVNPGTLYPTLEILLASPLAKKTIADQKYSDLDDIMKRAFEEGMITFSRSLADMYKNGKIGIDEGSLAATNKEEFLFLVQGMESGTETFRGGEDQDDGKKIPNMKRLLHSAVANNASDLIITADSRPALRLDGELQPLETDVFTSNDTKKVLFGVLNQKQRERFEENREIDFAMSVNIKRNTGDDAKKEATFRFRVNGFYQRGNVAVAVRIIPKTIPKPESLGLPMPLINFTEKRQGLILVTGPTGHGKSTTIASLIDLINSTRACHIITVEDPIEYVHTNQKAIIEQREIYSDTLSFAAALKYILRQNPDVILVGEMRDTETISAALTAAETGHLVFATLHTNDSAQSIDRITDSFPAHQQNQIRMQLSGSILGIVSQRLIQRSDGKGRIAAFEILIGSSAIKALIREGKTHLIQSTIELSAKDGMITMEKALKNLYEQNIISRKDALSFISQYQEKTAL
jgi:twitching motility protein PilT